MFDADFKARWDKAADEAQKYAQQKPDSKRSRIQQEQLSKPGKPCVGFLMGYPVFVNEDDTEASELNVERN
jgi:hypothetical protein